MRWAAAGGVNWCMSPKGCLAEVRRRHLSPGCCYLRSCAVWTGLLERASLLHVLHGFSNVLCLSTHCRVEGVYLARAA